MNKAIKFLPINFLIFFLTGCSFYCEYAPADFDMNYYLNVNDVVTYECEKYSDELVLPGGFKQTSPGGSCDGYRGIIVVSDAEGQRIKDAYNWTQCTQDIPFKNIDTTKYSQTWYSDVNNMGYFENHDTAILDHLYFDGKNTIVFDLMDREDFLN